MPIHFLSEEPILKLPRWSRRPAHSLLFITEAKSFRLDTDRQGVALAQALITNVGCSSLGQLPKTLDKLSDPATPWGRTLWILCLRLPSLLVSVPSLQVQGIDQATLTQALQFEAEGLTGLSSQQTRITFQRISAENDMTDFWLQQIDQLAWDDLLQQIKTMRCRLGGLLHPGALPHALQDRQEQDWLRLETWAGQLIALRHSDDQRRLQMFNLDSPHWRAELQQWLSEQQPVTALEILQNNRIEMLLDAEHQYSLREHEHIDHWLALWAEVLIRERAEGVSLFKPVAEINPQLAWQLAAGFAAVMLCGLHAGWFVYQKAWFERETKRLSEVEKALVEVRKQVADNTAERDKLDARLKKLTADPDWLPNAIQRLKQRPAQLMFHLATVRDEQSIIETLESKGNELTINGISLQQNAANRLADELQVRLASFHWQVGAASKQNMDLFEADPGPWSFKIVLTDQGMPELSALSH